MASESVIADFRAAAIYADTYRTDSEPCRVILSRDRLLVISKDRRRQIPLGSIFDIIVSRIPAELADFFDQTVLIGYTDNQTRRTVVIEGGHEQIDKFAMYLYKATLQGRTANVKHPARKGGRIVDSPHREAKISLTQDAVEFHGEEIDFQIDLSLIVDISQMKRTIDGTTQPVLSVRHVSGEQAITSEIFHPSVRKLNILARYLRLRYFQLEDELRQLDVSDQEAEALVALYSGGEIDHLAGMLDIEEPDVESLLADLETKELITDRTNPALTSWGQLLVSDRIDEINV